MAEKAVIPQGIEAYSFSTPFGYFCSYLQKYHKSFSIRVTLYIRKATPRGLIMQKAPKGAFTL
jgi:hypothetical protein